MDENNRNNENITKHLSNCLYCLPIVVVGGGGGGGVAAIVFIVEYGRPNN